jgi:hypothetical protein
VCCIGDTHGYINKLKSLWSNLQSLIDPEDFKTALIIFLGDYCDRGSGTRQVIDFLLRLPSTYPDQTHVFLCGNHDLAFAAFVGVLPRPPDEGFEFSEAWKEYEGNEDREGWFKGNGHEDMHLQGRRWGGTIKDRFNVAKGTEYKGSIYDAGPTFESYGVPHGSAGTGSDFASSCLILLISCILVFDLFIYFYSMGWWVVLFWGNCWCSCLIRCFSCVIISFIVLNF